MNLEELTKEYSIACAKAVRDGIHALVRQWDKDIVNLLNERDYYICAELYDDSLCIVGYIGKDDYYGYIWWDDSDMNRQVQELFDDLGAQVVLNAMIHYGWEETTQTITWRIY